MNSYSNELNCSSNELNCSSNDSFLHLSLMGIGKLVLSVLMDNTSNVAGLDFVLKNKKLHKKFLKFSEDAVSVYFYQTLKELNSFPESIFWREKANLIYEYYFSPRTLYKVGVKEGILTTLRELYEEKPSDVVFAKLSEPEKTAILRETFQIAEEEARCILCEKLPAFFKSHVFTLWWNAESAYYIGVHTHDTIVNEVKIENGLKMKTPKSATRFSDVVMTVLGLRGPPKVYDSHQEGYMLGHCVDYDSLSLNPFPLLNYHLHNCDAWLGVLLGAMQYLPVGLALHDYKASTGHVNGGRSSHRNEQVHEEAQVPFAYINPYYARHCGGYSNEEIYGKRHDFMFQTGNLYVDQAEKSSASPSARVSNKNCQLNITEELTLMDMEDLDTHSTRHNTKSSRNTDSLQSDSYASERCRRLQQEHRCENDNLEYCAVKNIEVLQKALSAKQKITISIPMKSKHNRVGDEYVNVMSWKPIMARMPDTDNGEVVTNSYTFADLSKRMFGKKADPEYLELMELLQESH